MILCCCLGGGRPAPATQPDIQRILNEHVDSGRAVGLVVGVIRDGERRFYSAGRLRADQPQPIDEHSVMEIGSISKVFTTLLLAQMDAQGLLRLQDPAQQYLPQALRLPTRNGAPITLEDLATHTSGLPRMPGNFKPVDPHNPYADYTVQNLYDFLKGLGPLQNVDGTARYSNLGMGLLGHILEQRSGLTYEQLLVTRIAKPLGLTHTTTRPGPDDAPQVAAGHRGRAAVSAWDIPTLAGAGDINASTSDLLTFTAANLGLPETPLYPAMRRCHAPRAATADPDLKVALGWHIWNKHGSEIIWHNGGTGGFASFLGFRQDTRHGVVVLSNSAYRTVDQIGLDLLNDR